MPPTVRRGYDPQDQAWFSGPGLVRLQTAEQEVVWLLDRDYPLSSVLSLVGGHHQLSARQRTALQRAAASQAVCRLRQAKQRPLAAGCLGDVAIDGLNLIITLETALSGSVLIRGADGVLRDLAGLRGTYRLISQTDQAIDLLGQSLMDLNAAAAHFYLDAPVSNSGRLRQRILERSSGWGLPVRVDLVTDPDTLLAGLDCVVSSDSVILDRCAGWFSLAAKLVADRIPQAWIVDLSGCSC